MPVRSVRLALVCGLLTAVGCSGPESSGAGSAPTRVDSAGVELVTHAVAPEDVGPLLTVDASRALRLGTLDGAPEEQFGSVADVGLLSDGGLAVLDRQAAEVRLFGADGGFRSTLGARGEGPGEFLVPTDLTVLPGDTLAVYDMRASRLTRFSPDGALVSTTTVERERATVTAVRAIPGGRSVGTTRWIAPEGGSLPGSEPTFVRDTTVYLALGPDGSVTDTLEVLPGSEMVAQIEISDQAVNVLRRPALLGRASLHAVGTDGAWVGASDGFELVYRSGPSWDVERILRAPGLQRAATPEMRETIAGRALSEAEGPDQRRWLEAWIDNSPSRELLPAFDRLVVDRASRLWVRSPAPGAEQATWWVFGPDGALSGLVRLPAGLDVTAVSCRHVAGIETDDLGVEYAVRYATVGDEGCVG